MLFSIACAASPRIGLGHFRRCSSLATALRTRGACIRWILDHQTLHTISKEIPQTDALLSLNQKNPERQLEEISTLTPESFFIIDSYPLSETFDHQNSLPWLRFDQDLSQHKTSASVIHCALPAANSHSFRPRCTNPQCEILAGTQFCILHPAFAEARKKFPKNKTQQEIHHVVLTAGGGDDKGLILYALQETRLALPKTQITIATTSKNPSLPDIIHATSQSPNTSLQLDRPHLADLFLKADLAVTAGGITTAELACLGVPAITIPIAENQIRPAQLWEAAGTVTVLSKPSPGLLAAKIQQLNTQPSLRQKMSNAGLHLVDGLGACRTAERLIKIQT